MIVHGALKRFAVAAATVVVSTFALRAGPAAAAQKHFTTPEEAVAALVAALKGSDQNALLEVLGPEAEDIVDSGDSVEDDAARDRFLESYGEANEIAKEGDAKAVLEVGKDQWPLPIPLVKEKAGWRFDSAAGAEEIVDRRVGRNELSAVQASLAYVDAQEEYYTRNPTGASLLHYAQKVASSPGKRDGLYWETKEGEEPSPLGPLIADARGEGYTKAGGGGGEPYHGYRYKILTSQGPAAPGGPYDYMARGEMIGGFGLVAYPAEYGVSGVMTFIVNHDGVVYQKDLGPKTDSAAPAIESFNPDSSWKRVDVEG